MTWQMMVATLHSNGQLRTESGGDAEKGCQKPPLQQKTTNYYYYKSTDYSDASLKLQGHFTHQIKKKTMVQ